MRASSPAAPPVWVWIASVLGAVAVLASSVPGFLATEAESQPGRPPAWVYDAIARFAENGPSQPAALRIVAFGDSALGTAVPPGPDMNLYARGRGLELDLLRVWLPFCVLHQVLPAIDSALAAAPDVLMIESWALVYPIDERGAEVHRAFQAEHGNDGGTLQRIAESPSIVLDHQAYLLDLFTGAAEEQPRRDPPEARPVKMAGARGTRRMRCDRGSRRRMLLQIEKRVPSEPPLSIDPLLPQTLDALLARARARGVRVVFFDIPRAAPIEALPGVMRKRALTLDLLRRYAGEGRAEFLEYSGKIADEDTCDYIHFTEVGRARYLPWFTDHLAALRQEGQK